MSSLNYLNSYSKHCDLKKLKEEKRIRDQWPSINKIKLYDTLLSQLPNIQNVHTDFSKKIIQIGKKTQLTIDHKDKLLKVMNQLIPWRKGPFNLFGIDLDGEWNSHLKWARIHRHIDNINDKIVLDIGCNNGYFMFKMAKMLPALVMGIDPMPRCQMQFNLLNHYCQASNLKYELFGIEQLKYFKNFFHTIFSMGIIYHHKNPIQQLIEINDALRPSGQLILETIGIPGTKPYALFPEDRYAKMRNIWFLPTESCLVNWAHKAKFTDIKIISRSKTTAKEQRQTKWCPAPYQSLDNFLDPNNKNKTTEGFPAPRRFCIIARKRK